MPRTHYDAIAEVIVAAEDVLLIKAYPHGERTPARARSWGEAMRRLERAVEAELRTRSSLGLVARIRWARRIRRAQEKLRRA